MRAVANEYKARDLSRTITDGNQYRYVLRVRDMETEDKPREKMIAGGLAELSMAELLAVVWGTGTKKEDVMQMSRRVLQEYGEKTMSVTTDPQKLTELVDIPLTKACQVIACLEIGRRYYSSKPDMMPVYIHTTEQAYHYVADIATSQKEQLKGIYLNSRYQVVHDEIISIGNLTSSIISAREVFMPALERGAVAVIIAHNHPSGDITPTASDIEVTDMLSQAGELLGVELLDHIIVSRDIFKSLKGE